MDSATALTGDTSTTTEAVRVPRDRLSGRRTLLLLHRWLSLAVAAFWLLQAITGLLLSFHWEIDDALISTAQRPTDLAALERRMAALAPTGGEAKINFIWTTAGLPDRYVVNMTTASGVRRLVKIDGGGDILRDNPAKAPGFLWFMRDLHINLAMGRTGAWILGISGALLMSNLVMGLVVAWPKRGWWKQALAPTRKGPLTARLYAWHRAIGLWAILPAFVIVGTGTLMLFEHGLRDALGVEEVELPPNPAMTDQIGLPAAIRAASAAMPGGAWVGTTLPGEADASYHVWLRIPGDLYRGYGSSLVVVDANDGKIRHAHPITDGGAAERFVGALYPVHSGEAGGLAGRLLTMSLGLWLAAITIMGLWLWLRRRPKTRR